MKSYIITVDNLKDKLGVRTDIALSEKIGVPVNTIRTWKTRGISPKQQMEFLNDIFQNEPPIQNEPSKLSTIDRNGNTAPFDLSTVGDKMEKAWKEMDPHQPKKKKEIKSLHVNNSIPLYPSLKASCSCGSVACNHVDGEVERIEFPKEYMLKTLGIHSTNGVHAIIADGESMEPTIKHGDIIFVEPCDSIKDSKVYIINIDDETYCKRVYKDLETGGLILRSDNVVAPEIKLSKSRALEMKIVGRVSVALSVVDL